MMLDASKRFLHKIQLKNEQRVINKQYEEEGLTDDVLEKQVKLNQKRHELDLHDENEFVYENFVQ